MAIEKKGVRLEHLSKIYQDQKTGKDFYAVQDANISIAPGEFVTPVSYTHLTLPTKLEV